MRLFNLLWVQSRRIIDNILCSFLSSSDPQFYKQLIQFGLQIMSFQCCMFNTPLKRHPHQSRMRHRVSVLAYRKQSSVEESKNRNNKVGIGIDRWVHKERRLNTEPLCEVCEGRSNDEYRQKQLDGLSPSLKAQKRQYLKLFSTASTQIDLRSQYHSRKGIKGSTHQHLKQPPSIQQLSLPISNKYKIQTNRGLLPRRRLFPDFVIENQQKLCFDEIQAQCSLSKYNQPSDFCHNCHNKKQAYLHAHKCPLLQGVLRLKQKEQLHDIKARGWNLIRKLELRSGELEQIPDNCNTFLKECDLAWSAGRPSAIYNFKLQELCERNRRLEEWMQDLQRLNQLLVMVQTQQSSLSH